MADISKIALPDGNTYDIKNDAVKQTRDIESNGSFDVLFSNSILDSSKTDSARIDYRFTYNPAAGRMSVNKISSLSEVRTPNVKGLHFYSGSTYSDLLFEKGTDGLTFGSYFLDALKEQAGITTTANSFTGTGLASDILAKRYGDVVTLYIPAFTSLSAGGYHTIATLSDAYKYNGSIYFDEKDQSGRNIRFYLSGTTLKTYNYGTAITSSNNTYFNLTYIIQ